MKKGFKTFSILVPAIIFIISFGSPDLKLVKEGSRWKLMNGSQTVSAPKDVMIAVESQVPLLGVLPDRKTLLFQSGVEIKAWQVGQPSSVVLLSLKPNSQGVSQPIFRDYGDTGEIFAAFVNLNETEYKNGTCIFILRIKEGQLLEKLKFDLPIEHEPGQVPVADKDFHFDGFATIYYTERSDVARFEEGEIDLDFQRRLKAAGRTMGLVEVGVEASSFYFEVHDANHQKVALPLEVEQAVFNYCGTFSPDERYLIYDDDNLTIKVFDFQTRKVTTLMTLLPGTEGLHDFTWDPTGKKVAFVNVNQEEYGTKLFVLSIQDGQLADKQKFDAQINFVCGSYCLSAPGSDFWWESPTRIGYLLHQAIEGNEGKTDFIQVNP